MIIELTPEQVAIQTTIGGSAVHKLYREGPEKTFLKGNEQRVTTSVMKRCALLAASIAYGIPIKRTSTYFHDVWSRLDQNTMVYWTENHNNNLLIQQSVPRGMMIILVTGGDPFRLDVKGHIHWQKQWGTAEHLFNRPHLVPQFALLKVSAYGNSVQTHLGERQSGQKTPEQSTKADLQLLSN